VAQLCQYEERLKQLGVNVLLISFSEQKEAKTWLYETCPSFQLLLDRDRSVYLAYELKRSLFNSWNLKTLWYYIRALLNGTKWQGIKGDSIQLGGDFIIKSDGRFVLVHPSKEATDRPKVSAIITLLEKDS
jgi:hypothetical protein